MINFLSSRRWNCYNHLCDVCAPLLPHFLIVLYIQLYIVMKHWQRTPRTIVTLKLFFFGLSRHFGCWKASIFIEKEHNYRLAPAYCVVAHLLKKIAYYGDYQYVEIAWIEFSIMYSSVTSWVVSTYRHSSISAVTISAI